jgi:hypothetical protein
VCTVEDANGETSQHTREKQVRAIELLAFPALREENKKGRVVKA